MNPARPRNFYLILMLGALTALAPFSIDMYLPAFPKVAADLGIQVSRMALTLSSFFIGLAVGQLFYGPLLDRYGRKPPLYAGLLLYCLATVGCLLSRSIEALVAFRFIQAIGACAANVASMAMVRDFFSPKESAKVFSLLVLILGVSPLLAPTVGGYLALTFGWQAVFITLGVIGALMLIVTFIYLPEGHPPDTSHSLHPLHILKNYVAILKNPHFLTYTLAGSVAFSGLFVYLASSPMIFMEIYHIGPKTYSWIFALIAAGFIGFSQFNILLLRRFSNERVLLAGMIGLTLTALAFFAGTYYGAYGLGATIFILFLILASAGVTNPNTAALALAPFSKNAGSAAALLGSLQMSLGALGSVSVGLLKTQRLLPIAALFAVTGLLSLAILIFGRANFDDSDMAGE